MCVSVSDISGVITPNFMIYDKSVSPVAIVSIGHQKQSKWCQNIENISIAVNATDLFGRPGDVGLCGLLEVRLPAALGVELSRCHCGEQPAGLDAFDAVVYQIQHHQNYEFRLKC